MRYKIYAEKVNLMINKINKHKLISKSKKKVYYEVYWILSYTKNNKINLLYWRNYMLSFVMEPGFNTQNMIVVCVGKKTRKTSVFLK
jgi:hypothetical protein